jgi:peptidyl-prolyl cis-trans isomerase A (cyclophilin A)
MHRYIALFFVLVSLPLASQTTTAKKPVARKPAAVAAGPSTAIIDTTAGKLTCTLMPDKAPIGTANFVGLAKGTKVWTNPRTGKKVRGVPLYNGAIFHRVIPNFMIQGGDPLGTGEGDPGYKFKNETSPDLTFDRPGRLAYANAGPDTNGSQFFITEVPYPSLDGKYTIFGQCDLPSVELVKKIARMPRNANDRPDDPVKINKITIVRGGPLAAKTATGTTPKPKPAPHATKQQ